MEKYLPIGSVVLLKENTKRLMIFGRRIIEENNTKEWDYIGCYYPEGKMDKQHTFLFDHEQIELVYMVGFQDIEEITFQNLYLQQGGSNKWN